MRVAIFGGTFDPIHEAHLAVARVAAGQFRLERVLFVVAARPPHKAGATQASYADRVRMAELACGCQRGFEVSRLEEGANYSYSIDTVRKLRTGLAAEDELYFIIGADAFAEITSWYRWQEVVQSVRFIVVSRPGHVYQVPAGATVERLDQIELPISSSGIRAALARGERPTGLPAPVMEYIVAHGLYGANVPV